ncbi:MAG: NAD-dependent epimerase/dehydratase family protein [Deltaproteobacteria bacterium]|nr:NAD-dependent epimerase/dehydratase family protein [Deltaproteobacteria bacterium]
MRILITGARGFIGSHIVKALLQPPGRHELHGLSRIPGPTKLGTLLTTHVGDVTDPPTLPAACSGIEVIIHCVQFPNHPIENPRKGWTYLRVDGEGTRNLVNAAKAAGVRRFIYLSGLGVGPDRAEPWFRAKWMAESAIRQSGMEYVIFRPSLVYGPEDRSANRFLQMIARLPVIPVIGNGRQRIQPVFVDELAELVAKAVDLPAATNQVFDVGGTETYTFDDFLRTLARSQDKRCRLIHIPKAIAKAAAFPLQWLPTPPLTPGAVDFLTMDAVADTRATQEVFGWTQRPLVENLPRHIQVKAPH